MKKYFTKESLIRERDLYGYFSRFHLENLKSHHLTRSVESFVEVKKILDFVYKQTKCEDLYSCKIYSISNSGLDEMLSKALKKSHEMKIVKEKNIFLSMAKTYTQARGFFYTPTKEVFYLTNANIRFKDSKKPDRFNDEEWRLLQIRTTLVHELNHFVLDSKTKAKNEGFHERFAYASMIPWCRSIEKLTDEEIAEYIIDSFGQRVVSENYKIKNKKDFDYFKEKAHQRNLAFIKEMDALNHHSDGDGEDEGLQKTVPLGLEI